MGVGVGGTGVGGTGVGGTGVGGRAAVGGAAGDTAAVGLAVGVAVALAPQALNAKTNIIRAMTNHVLRKFIVNLLDLMRTPLCENG
jgi:hypothetical protein